MRFGGALLAITAVWLALALPAAAATVVVDQGFDRAAVGASLSLLDDPGRVLEFEQVRARDAEFRPSESAAPTFGFTRSAWWARLTLRNGSDAERRLLLRQDYPLIDELDLWQQDGRGGWLRTATGDLRPFDSRDIRHRDFLFELVLPPQAERTVYLRYATSGALNISLTLYETKTLIAAIGAEQLAYGVYYGGFLVLVFYNLFIFLAVRDRPFVYYLLYAVSYGLYFGVHNGLSFEYLWPDSPQWGNLSLLVLLSLTLVFGLQFSRLFLDTRSIAPRLDRLAMGLQGLSLLALLLALVLPYSVLIAPLAWVTVLVTGTIVAMGIAGMLAGYRPARWFMLAWAMLLLSVFVYMFKTFGWLPHNALTQNAFQVGALLEMVLLSIALADRVRDLQRQSLTDALTGLGNRRSFDDQLAHALQRAGRRHVSIALAVVDIDHFKKFNDRFGHARGDDVLRLVARHLKAQLPAGSSVSRYGGEEFAVILPRMDGAEAVGVAEHLRSSLRAQRFADQAITISIGVACTGEAGSTTAAKLFEAADSALYEAKSAGRNRVVLHDPRGIAAADSGVVGHGAGATAIACTEAAADPDA